MVKGVDLGALWKQVLLVAKDENPEQ